MVVEIYFLKIIDCICILTAHQKTPDSVAFTEEILNGKLHFSALLEFPSFSS